MFANLLCKAFFRGGIWLVIVLSMAACGKPQDFAEADNARLLTQPTATYAAIKNHEAAIYATVVAPVQAQADAKSIQARTDQKIVEDRHTEELRYTGELMALTVSNTLRLNVMAEQHTANVEAIHTTGVQQAAQAQVLVADAAASAEERAAQARMATGLSLGLMAFLIIIAVGGAFALVKALDNRATIIDRTPDGSIKAIIKHGQIVYDSGLAVSPMTAVTGPNTVERLFLLLAMWQQMNRGGEHASPWQVYREYKQITSPTLAHPLPASEEAALRVTLGAQQARVEALATQAADRSTARAMRTASVETETAPLTEERMPTNSSLIHPAFQQPLPQLELLDVIDAETVRALELATGQS